MDEKRKAVSSLVAVPGRDEPQSGVTFLNDTGRSLSLVGGWPAGMDMFHDSYSLAASAGFDGWER